MRLFISLIKWSIILVILMGIIGYFVYNSDKVQKKYIYPFLYQEDVNYYAKANNLSPYFVAAVIRTESKFNTHARSPKGAVGLMQLMPDTAVWLAKEMELTQFTVGKLEDPEVSIRMGTWYLASLKSEFKGNTVLALAAYNGGRGNVRQWMKEYGWDYSFKDYNQIPFQETREFVKKVLDAETQYRRLYGG